MKSQVPNPKFQRSSKLQFPGSPQNRIHRTIYSVHPVAAPRLNEEANENRESARPFELEERTAQFGEAIVCFAKRIPRSPANDRLIGQLVGYGTSIGANYCEADERVPKKDREYLPKMTSYRVFGIWSLELLWDLELGIWDL